MRKIEETAGQSGDTGGEKGESDRQKHRRKVEEIVKESQGSKALRKLVVSKLPEYISTEEMEFVFGTYGKVLAVSISPTHSKQGTRSGNVEYETPEAAGDAKEVLHNIYKFRPEAPEAIQVTFAGSDEQGSEMLDGMDEQLEKDRARHN